MLSLSSEFLRFIFRVWSHLCLCNSWGMQVLTRNVSKTCRHTHQHTLTGHMCHAIWLHVIKLQATKLPHVDLPL